MRFTSFDYISGYLSRIRDRRGKDELAFLPAALEIAETPPSPIGRAVGATLIALFCLALAWAAWGKVDMVASASGKIIPSGRTKVVQPFETGVVRAIHVQDGARVAAGDPLIELDPTANKSELEHAHSDLIATQLEIARLRAALTEEDDPLAAFLPPAQASPDQIATQRGYLLDQINEQRAKLAALDRQRAQKEAERATIAATINKIEAVIPVVQQRFEIRKALFASEYGSKLQYFEALQLLVEQQQELLVQKSRYQETDAALAAIIETRAQTAAEYRRIRFGELVAAEQKAAGLAQDLIKAKHRTGLQLLTAPIDGVVQQLAVHTVGGVVTPAQALLVIVPLDTHLEIEAMVSNRDIGFVQVGQDVEIKVETFTFTRYGLLRGKVLNVSQDAITHDSSQEKPTDKPQNAERIGSAPNGQELVYAARISLDRTQMEIDDRLVNLSAGMAVTVEIKTGARTVLSYVLSPLLRYKQETLRER